MKQLQLQQWVEPLVAHHLAYTFLGKAFYEPPSGDLMRAIALDNLFEAWPLAVSNARMEHGLETLQAFSQGWDDDQLASLKRDHARLFVGPGELLAVPWESVYRSAEGLIFDAQTLEVRRLYRQYGMDVPKPGLEPEDHIGLEMRFVAHLCASGLQAAKNGRADGLEPVLGALRHFFDAHLSQWANQCFERVQQRAETPYYRGVAELASGSVAHAIAWLAQSPEESADV